ncbi:MAG TPA: hypothetical protein DCL66_15060 [Gammaproteobacteria bacterium]|nr:hypothetical protein [Gammaproteobacteria bacterium]
MKSPLLNKVLLVAALGICSQFAMADNESAAKSIAGVLVNLNHFPSAEEKVTLKAISEDEATGRAFRAVALAVHNIQHAATAEDKANMAQVIENDMAASEAKELAVIVVSFNHMPSADAKAALQAML